MSGQPAAEQTATKSPSSVCLQAILGKIECGEDGVWVIRIKVDASQREQVCELSQHTEKLLQVAIVAPDEQPTYGKVTES